MKDYGVLLAMLFLQVTYAAMYLMTRVALTQGMSLYIYVAYRQIIATLLISPLAYFLERNQRPPLRVKNVWQIFILALLGITLNQSFYNAGLAYTSTTFASTIVNLIPAMTFVMAFFLKLEVVNLKSKKGIAKVVGTVSCVGGGMIMTLIKGPALKSLNDVHDHINELKTTKWMLGSLFLFAGALSWSTWMIYQVWVIEEYPPQVSLTALLCFMATIQSSVIALLFEDISAWKVHWDIQLLTCVYSGVFASAIGYLIQVWSVKKKGPVFATAFSPLTTVLVAILEPLLLGVPLHLGSLVGMVLVISGLYAVLWGKTIDPMALQQNQNVEPEIGEIGIEEEVLTEPLLLKMDVTRDSK